MTDTTHPTPLPEYTTEYIVSLHGNPTWEAIWSVIRRWDISRLSDGLYSDATGDDATRIFDAIAAATAAPPPPAMEKP